MNANQFDDDGLPGIDKDYPPEHSWGAEDPALVNSDDASDNLVTRVAREAASELEQHDVDVDAAPPLMDPAAGDPAAEGELVDDESQAIALSGVGDPDAGPTAEEAAMHVVDDLVDDVVADPPDGI